MPEIYQPAEDSFLLNESVKSEIRNLENKKIKVLDMGSGSGIQAETCIEEGISPGNLIIADINSKAIKFLKNKFPGSEVIKSNLFENVKGKFDLIIFNPPYLPEDEFDKEEDTTGGKKGSEVINEFLSQAKVHLFSKGIILLLTSSLSGNIDWNDYKTQKLSQKKLFFEELYVWKLQL